jgi:signal transduction histidine kinase
MSLSRLRLRLAGAFAVTFALALAVVATAALGWLWRESTRRLDRRLALVAANVQEAVRREGNETPDSSFAMVLEEVHRDWVAGPEQWVLLHADGRVLTGTAPDAVVARVLARRREIGATAPTTFEVTRDGDDQRALVRHVAAAGPWPAYEVIALASTEGIERDSERLALTLALIAPLILLASLAGGYVMARRALRPVDALGQAIDALGPTRVGGRLPVSAPADELDRLAVRFNALLDRLDAAQAQNRTFVREAAHQIRTPLTLVRGEAEHALAAPAPEASVLSAALMRIRTASTQMDRRVGELFLLAEAEAGGRIERTERVDLDGLVVETVDLFRSRARELGRSLAFGDMDSAFVHGHGPLLREAVLELLENAARHGAAGSCITVRVAVEATTVIVTIQSALAPSPHTTAARPPLPGTRLGHRIVQWIAEGHGGRFEATTSDDGVWYRASLFLPSHDPASRAV